MKTLFAIVVLFLFGCVFVAATAINVTGNVTGEITTTQTNFTISPGEILVVSNFSIEDIEPSPTIGGLVSSLSFYYERYLDFVGLKVWESSSTTSPEFELLAFPSGSVLGENIVQGKLFMSSELVILENRTETEHTWLTYNTDVSWGEGADFQTLVGLDQIMGSSCGSLTVISINGNAGYVFDYNTYSKPIEECTPTLCPSATELFAFGLVYGVDYDEIRTFKSGLGSSRVLILELNSNLVGFLIDKNCDAQWDFMQNVVQGFLVNSWENHALILLPTDATTPVSYDFYCLI